MAGPDGNHYDSYQNESETTTLLSPSPPSSPRRSKDHGLSSPAAAEEDVRKHYKYALGTGYMFAMGVCGIVLVALGSTLDDLAENCDTTATDVRDRESASAFFFHDKRVLQQMLPSVPGVFLQTVQPPPPSPS